MRTVTAAIAGAVLLCLQGAAFAAPPMAFTTRTQFFGSTSTTDVPIPLRNNGTTTLRFQTTIDNEPVVITYNAECIVTAPRGVWLTISILVDGVQANPASGQDFALCSALDTGGQSWGSVSRQSVFTVPNPGIHTVSITGKLRGDSGSFGLDDSSLVVQRARASATRTTPFVTSQFLATELPLKNNDAKILNFNTPVANDRMKFTYNAECVVDAEPTNLHRFIANFAIDGQQLDIATLMCSQVDTAAQTWAGALRQQVVTVPAAGVHQLKMLGALLQQPGTWRIDDTSLVVTRGVLAYGTHDGISALSTTAVPVPLKDNGGFNLKFTTTKANQMVRFGFYAECLIDAPRGRWLGIRVLVDGVETAPASGYDFALCSSGGHDRWAGFRQSVMTVPTAGDHFVRVYGRISGGPLVTWSLGTISMVVE
jgi:hypothetical protein